MIRPSRPTIVLVLVALLASTAVAPAALADSHLEYGDERADLDIRQPAYVEDEVVRNQQANTTEYQLTGPRHEIRLESLNHSEVVGFGILQGSGTLEYNAESDAYVFRADGEAGTRVVYWDVERTYNETREVANPDGNGTTTETVQKTEEVRHVATLKVSEVEWAHRPKAEDESLKQAAANWSSVASQARRLGGGDDVETVIEDAFEYYKFAESPFSSFAGDARGTIMMATRPGGLAVFGTVFGLAAVVVAIVLVRLHRREKQLAEAGDIDQARDGAYLEMARKTVQQWDYSRHLPEHLSRFMRKYLGRNVWLGHKRYMLMRTPEHTKGLVLQLMAQVGYVGKAERDDAGDLVSASVVRENDDVATDGGAEAETVDLEALDPSREEDREFVSLVPGDQLDTEILYEPEELDLDRVEWPIDDRKTSDSEIVDELDPDFPDDFEDAEELAEALAGMIHLVANSDYTTDDGKPKGERDLLGFLAELDSTLTDEVDFPLAHVQRRVLFLAADRMDKGEELQETIDQMESEGLELGGELDDDDRDPDDRGGAFAVDDDPDDPDSGAAAVDDVDQEEDSDDQEDDVDEEEDSDEPDESDNADKSGSSDSETDAPVDGSVDGSTTGARRDDDGSTTGEPDDVPLRELAERAGYDVDDDEDLREIAREAGITPDMGHEAQIDRLINHFSRDLDMGDILEVLEEHGDGGR